MARPDASPKCAAFFSGSAPLPAHLTSSFRLQKPHFTEDGVNEGGSGRTFVVERALGARLGEKKPIMTAGIKDREP